MRRYIDEFVNLKRKNLFNSETINIFSDASYRKMQGIFGGGAVGATMVYQNEPIDSIVHWNQIEEETVNSLELKALRIAVSMAFSAQVKLQEKRKRNIPISYINIFSDSKYSVCAIKDYMFDGSEWIWNYNKKAYVKPKGYNIIPNQELIIEISNMILKFQAINPHIIFDMWWCPAHIRRYSNKQIKDAANRFRKINSSGESYVNVDPDFIRYVCTSNNTIDKKVHHVSNDYNQKDRKIVEPIRFYYGP